MRVGNAHHETEWLIRVRPDELDGFVGQEISRERFRVRALHRVGRLALGIPCFHAGTGRGVFELLPVTAIEHVAVIVEAKLSGRSPSRPGRAVEMPLARVTGRVSNPAQHFGERDHVVAHRQIISDGAGVLWIPPRAK